MKTLFWDKNVGKAIPSALQLLNPSDVTIKYYLEVYRGTDSLPEMGDDVWLREVGERNWFVISQDYNLHRRNNGLFALKQYNIGCFYLWGANSPKWETFRCFSRSYDRIVETMANTPRPFLYRIQQNGALRNIPLP